MILRDFYLQTDVVSIAKQLLGKVLCTRMNGVLTSGMITETEAYAGIVDRASHAYGGKRTSRTEVMYRQGGTAYVYLCYGMHSLFNVVTNVEGEPHAVLIRGIQPIEGVDEIMRRFQKTKLGVSVTNGPGKVAKALGIHVIHTGTDLVTSSGNDGAIWIEERGFTINPSEILAGPRIGVEYAKEDAHLPYRFLIGWK